MVKFRIFLFNLILIALGSILIISNKQVEAGTLNRPGWDSDPMVATKDTTYPSGLLPRGVGVDMSTGSGKNNKNTTSWTASVDDHETFFCSGYGKTLRFGYYDPTLYFYAENGYRENCVGQGGVVVFSGAPPSSYDGKWTDLLESSIAARMDDSKKYVWFHYPDADGDDYYYYNKPPYYKNVRKTRNTKTMYNSILSKLNNQISALSGELDYSMLRVYYDYDAVIPYYHTYHANQDQVEISSAANLEKTKQAIFSRLDPSWQSVPWGGSDITGGGIDASAPTVVVMEKALGSPGTRGYKTGGAGGENNSSAAYILTSLCEDCYGTAASRSISCCNTRSILDCKKWSA